MTTKTLSVSPTAMHFDDATLYQGDNLDVLEKYIPNESANLVYIDPPFNSGERRISEVGLSGPLREFEDSFSSIDAYLDWMRPRLIECIRALRSGGALFLHCDWRSSHYLRVELDRLLGYDNFVNEIAWQRHTSHNDFGQGSRHFGRNLDVILFYGKGERKVWNQVFRPYSEDYARRVYQHIEAETGRRYALSDLSGPGGAVNGNPVYSFMGFTRAWRYSQETMLELQRDGQIVRTQSTGMPRRKRYLDQMQGIAVQALWDDISCLPSRERESYPTQKPLALLERIIRSSTDEEDLILDPFCGSGTSIVAALNLKRRAIGIDYSADAIALASQRLETTIKPS